jgi:hypothetical protein
MQDLPSVHKKDHKMRVASLHHVGTKPIWLQFGDKANTCLHLCHIVSTAEEKWFFIVNYVMKLLVNFVNAHLIRDSPGQVAPADKFLRIRRYGTLVENTGEPRSGNYNLHDRRQARFGGSIGPMIYSFSIDGINPLSSKSLGFQH